MKNFWTAGTLLMTWLMVLPLARADEKGEHVLQLLDKRLTICEDQEIGQKIITKEKGKAPREMEFRVWIKGTDWRLVEFLSPGDVKGMKVLVRSKTQSYVYLPSYRRVRRVASHTRDQGFMGTVLNQDDIATVTYGDIFTGKLLAEDDKHWTLELNLKPGKEYSYSKIVFVILKDLHAPVEGKYYNKKGVHVKTETRSDYVCKGVACNPNKMVWVDHTRNDMSTELHQTYFKPNTGIKDSYFTVRSLQRR